MALGSVKPVALSAAAAGAGVTVPGSAYGTWQTLHDDISSTVTAETAAVLFRPLTATTSSIRPVKVGPGVTRMILRVKYPQAVAVATTHAVVQIFGVYGEISSDGTFADDGTVKFVRLDSADNTNAGLTMTVTNATDTRDTTYRYSNVKPDLTGIDLKGCNYVLALVKTAGVITTSSGALVLGGLALN